jgi:membrane fusion protein, multidrug efflux system
MQRKRFVIIAVVAVAAIGLSILTIGASQRSSSGSGAADAAKAGPGGMPRPGSEGQNGTKTVKTKAATLKTLRPYLDEGGDVEASVNVSVYPDIGGRLAEIKVALGDSVRKGETIAAVDPSKPGSSYSMSAIPSPISGTITSVIAEPGETVSTSTAILKVGVIDDLEIIVNLPERDSAKVSKGMQAEVSLTAVPGQKLKATISRVSPVLDSASRTREVRLVFQAKDARVAAGMYAEARIFIEPLVDRIVIPQAAVLSRNDESYVYAVAEGVAKKAVVKLGTEVDGFVEVSSGIKVGDDVVIEGQDQLSDGKKVEKAAGSVE